MKSVTEDDRLNAVDHETRLGLVCSAVGDRDAVMMSWHTSVLPGGGSASNYRVNGQARTHGRPVPWSLVLKWFSPVGDVAGLPASVEESTRGFWKREWLLYQAPWFGEWEVGLTGPRVFGTGEADGTNAWVAMEDLSSFDERPWSLRHFGTVARQTGQFNGSFLAGDHLPTAPWLCQHWSRVWLAQGDPTVVLDAEKGNTVVEGIFSPAMVSELRWLWQTRHVLQQALDGLPETLCHGDLHPRNAFLRKTSQGDQAVAIDWSACGPGPVGADLASLVGSSIFLLESERVTPDDLEARCLEGYLAGLREAGWDGSDDDVKFGYLASLVIHFSVSFTELVVGFIVSDKDHAWGEGILGRTIPDFLNNYHALLTFLEPRVQRVRQAVQTRVGQDTRELTH